MFLAIGTTTVTIAAGAALGSRIFLIHWTPTTAATFSVLMAVGMFKLAYAEVSAAVGAIAKGSDVLKFSGLAAATLVVGIGVTIILGITWGMLGAAVGALGLWALRVLISYVYMVKRIDYKTPGTQDT